MGIQSGRIPPCQQHQLRAPETRPNASPCLLGSSFQKGDPETVSFVSHV